MITKFISEQKEMTIKYKLFVVSAIIVICLISSILLLIIKTNSQNNKLLFLTSDDYPNLKPLEEKWNIIKEEIPHFDKYKKMRSREQDEWDNQKGQALFEKIRNEPEWIKGWMKEVEWYNYPLIYMGKPMALSDQKCPKTYEILKSISNIKIAGYALLKAGHTLEKHKDSAGFKNGSMAANMQLIGESSSLFIENTDGIPIEHKHKDGKIIIFDSTNTHYASNNSNKDRIILYLEFSIPKSE
jgi:beta-hydroxylase